MYSKYKTLQLKKNELTLLFSSLSAVTLLVLVPFFFLLMGCAENQSMTQENPPQASKTATQGSSPHVSPYFDLMVNEVEVRYIETNPVQIEIVIQGTLPDQCKYEFYSSENRRNQDVKITLKVRHPAGDCDQVSQNVEYTLLLGQNKPEAERGFSPGDYTLIVNKYQTVITIKEK